MQRHLINIIKKKQKTRKDCLYIAWTLNGIDTTQIDPYKASFSKGNKPKKLHQIKYQRKFYDCK